MSGQVHMLPPEDQTANPLTEDQRSKIESAREDLAENWAISHCITDLYSQRIILPAEKDELDETPLEFDKVGAFLDMLVRKDQDAFNKVIQIMYKNQQGFVAVTLINGGAPKEQATSTTLAANGRRMTDDHRAQIQGAWKLLVENWAITQCIDAMIAERVLTQHENLTLKAIKGERKKVEAFLKLFQMKPDDTFETVVRITEKKKQPQIAALLRNGGD